MKAAVALLRLLASVLVLSCLIGLLVTVFGMAASFLTLGSDGTVEKAALAKTISLIMWVTWVSFLFFPIGAVLHWIIAKKTGAFPSWCRQSLFWGSLFMCIAFPMGTIMGGIALWKLITSDVLKVREQLPAPV
jgi:hypothetical protein